MLSTIVVNILNRPLSADEAGATHGRSHKQIRQKGGEGVRRRRKGGRGVGGIPRINLPDRDQIQISINMRELCSSIGIILCSRSAKQ